MPNEHDEIFEVRWARFETQVNARLARHEEVMRQFKEELAEQSRIALHIASQLDSAVIPTQRELLEKIRLANEQIDDQGGTIDHAINTIDSMLVPTVAEHSRVIVEFSAETKLSHDFRVSQQGAWAFVQKVGVVIAACASVITMVMKFAEHGAK